MWGEGASCLRHKEPPLVLFIPGLILLVDNEAHSNQPRPPIAWLLGPHLALCCCSLPVVLVLRGRLECARKSRCFRPGREWRRRVEMWLGFYWVTIRRRLRGGIEVRLCKWYYIWYPIFAGDFIWSFVYSCCFAGHTLLKRLPSVLLHVFDQLRYWLKYIVFFNDLQLCNRRG